MSAPLPQFLMWMKRKIDPAPRRDVVNLAISGVSTEFATRWLNEVITSRAAEIAERSAESNQFGLGSLKQAIRNAFQVPADREIVTTMGASAGIRLVSESLVAGRPDAEVIIESPVYEPIWSIVCRLGAKLVPVARTDGLASIARLITRNTAAVFLTNLHNPTGHWLSYDELAQLADELEAVGSKALIVVDETFADIGPSPGTTSAIAHRRIVTISSLSKSHGLSPLRCGWMTVDPNVLPQFVEDAVLFQNLGHKVAEVLGAMAIESIDQFRAAARQHLGSNRALLAEWLREMAESERIEPQELLHGCIVFPRIRTLGRARSSLDLVELLDARYGVLVAPGVFFGKTYEDHIRIGFGGDHNRIRLGLPRLADGLASLS
jgi:aspartate/methionine/tyrosine aminotransferase